MDSILMPGNPVFANPTNKPAVNPIKLGLIISNTYTPKTCTIRKKTGTVAMLKIVDQKIARALNRLLPLKRSDMMLALIATGIAEIK